jgi:type II secretory pathway component PulC
MQTPRMAFAFSISARAQANLRTAIEGLLFGAAAIGLAQTGWSLLGPRAAPSEISVADMTAESVRTPFAPEWTAANAPPASVAASLAGLQLAGLRMAIDPARSGAIVTLADGAQRAFGIGHEVAPGLRLEEVRADRIVLAYEGGRHELALPGASDAGPASTLVASAESVVPASYAEPVIDIDPAEVRTAEDATPASIWLTATLSQPGAGEGGVAGWRVAAPLPQAATASGVQPGDLVVSINGSGPSDLDTALQATDAQAVELTILRGGERASLTLPLKEDS